jgi:hypothetical protein
MHAAAVQLQLAKKLSKNLFCILQLVAVPAVSSSCRRWLYYYYILHRLSPGFLVLFSRSPFDCRLVHFGGRRVASASYGFHECHIFFLL